MRPPTGRFLLVAVGFLLLFEKEAAAEQFVFQSIAADSLFSVSLRPFGHSVRTDSLWINGLSVPFEETCHYDSASGLMQCRPGTIRIGDTVRLLLTTFGAPFPLSYGRPIPAATPVPRATSSSIDNESPDSRLPLPQPEPTDRITIAGAKTFRVQSSGTGGASFGQSLDLQIDGQLGENVLLSGSVSDRQDAASYGPLNSQLSELDRLQLTLRSPHFSGSIGDQTVRSLAGQAKGSSFFGVHAGWKSRRWNLSAHAGRPRGRFSSIRLIGRDGFQGPYLVAANGRTQSIVPGSVQVWLDGTLMEEGSQSDFTVDYPLGGILFTGKRPIDSRTRIEIDFEPLAADYRQELAQTIARFEAPDSSVLVQVGFEQRRDNPDDRLAGDLSSVDRDLLSQSGDQAATRSGIEPDSLGAYLIVADSLPDTVLVYVGPGLGDYRVTFNFVGAGAGAYRYAGLEQYVFAGAGNGDYQPQLRLVPPRSEQLGTLAFALRPAAGMQLSVNADGLASDLNRLSGIGDDNNLSGQVLARFAYASSASLVDSIGFAVRRRIRGFDPSGRVDSADDRRVFLLPDSGLLAPSGETRWSAAVRLRPVGKVSIVPQVSLLARDKLFSAQTGSLTAAFRPALRHEYEVTGTLSRGELTLATELRTGEARTIHASTRTPLVSSVDLVTTGAYDRRTDSYAAVAAGAREWIWETAFESGHWRLGGEFLSADSLTEADWQRTLDRIRVVGSLTRTAGLLRLNGYLAAQHTKTPLGRERQVLTHSGLFWHDRQLGLRIGQEYRLSSETRNARLLRYLEVEAGSGQYILVDSQYLPDPNGNFVRVEELISDQARVRTAEKQTTVEWTSSRHQTRLVSKLVDELLPEGSRNLTWLIPLTNDPSQPTLLFQRLHDLSLQLLPIRGIYLLQLTATMDRDLRSLTGGASRRDDELASLIVRQRPAVLILEERLDYFAYDRSAYLGRTETVKGVRASVTVRRPAQRQEIGGSLAFRTADDQAGNRSQIGSLTLTARRSLPAGDVRLVLEGYRSFVRDLRSSPSLLLSDNRPGESGAVWNLTVLTRLQRGVRINAQLNGRTSDMTTGRTTGRLEVIADL